MRVPVQAPSQPSFYEDRFWSIWILHLFRPALAMFDRDANKLTHYSLHDPSLLGTALTGVTSMLEDRNGALWLGTHGAGLLKFDRDHRRFVRYRNNPAIPTVSPERRGEPFCGSGRQHLGWPGSIGGRPFHHQGPALPGVSSRPWFESRAGALRRCDIRRSRRNSVGRSARTHSLVSTAPPGNTRPTVNSRSVTQCGTHDGRDHDPRRPLR